jgi:hypothetical protein
MTYYSIPLLHIFVYSGRQKALFAGERIEDVLERAIVGDAHTCFAFADGWFAVYLGDGNTLMPTQYTVLVCVYMYVYVCICMYGWMVCCVSG